MTSTSNTFSTAERQAAVARHDRAADGFDATVQSSARVGIPDVIQPWDRTGRTTAHVHDAIARHRRVELMVAAAVLTEVASTTNGSPLADAVAEILDQLQQLLHHLADDQGAIT